MDNKSEYYALTQALEEFSVPYKTIEEAKTVSIKLDALVSVLLKTSFAERRVGPKRLKELSSGTAAAPSMLREIGGEAFERVAQLAGRLINFDLTLAGQGRDRPSVLDIGGFGSDEMLDEANANREAFLRAFRGLLPSIVGD